MTQLKYEPTNIMKPTYFPFTYVAGRAAEAVATCFGQFIVYRPRNDKVPQHMQALVDQGVVDLRVPVTENEKELKAAVKNYLAWANLHMRDSAKKTADLKSRMGVWPLFDDFSSSQILADIKAKIRGGSADKIMDPTFTARIFLCLAEEFDRQNQEVTHELYRYHWKQADLIGQLKMEEDPLAVAFPPQPLPDRLADDRISDRLEAWTRIFQRDPDASGLFVTHSPAVLEHLLDKSPTADRVMRLESIPLDKAKALDIKPWQQKMAASLARLAQDDQPSFAVELPEGVDFPPADNAVCLSVHLVPNQTPAEFFARCAGLNLNDTEKPVQKGKIKNTLFALIEGLGNYVKIY
jgi:hypothetical protein